MPLSAEQFQNLAMEQMDTVYRVARRLTRDPSDADDLVQETFLRAFRARESFKLQEFGIRPWLLRILHNTYLTGVQRQQRRPQALEESALESAAPGGGSDELPIDPASWDAMDQRLVEALEALPSEYKVVMLLWAVEDMSYKEIADSLDVPIGTVMSRLHRARTRLGAQLKDFAAREGIRRE
jgi:RNA polymerase sigma-70 factor, ECF subfamily